MGLHQTDWTFASQRHKKGLHQQAKFVIDDLAMTDTAGQQPHSAQSTSTSSPVTRFTGSNPTHISQHLKFSIFAFPILSDSI